MLPEFQKLREVQDLDLRIADLDGRIAAAPALLRELDRRIEAKRAPLREAEEALEQAGRDRKHSEADLQDAEASIAKYDDQLMQARTNIEYKGIQTQIANTRERISGLEDRILGLWDSTEELKETVATRRRDHDQARQELEAEKEKVRRNAASDLDRREALKKQRAGAAAALPPDVHARYERIRRTRQGVAVARARNERCSACSVRLRPQLYEEVRLGQKILSCEACSRILYFEPESAD